MASADLMGKFINEIKYLDSSIIWKHADKYYVVTTDDAQCVLESESRFKFNLGLNELSIIKKLSAIAITCNDVRLYTTALDGWRTW